MSVRQLTDTELAEEVNRHLRRGGNVETLFNSLSPSPPSEWRDAAIAFALSCSGIAALRRQFGTLCQEEIQRNIGDKATRRDRPGRAWAFLPALLLHAPDNLPAVAAQFYEIAVEMADLAETQDRLAEEDKLHKGMELNNLGLARLALGDHIGALEAILSAIAEDERTRPGEPSHARSNVLMAALLEPAENRFFQQIVTVLPQRADSTFDTALISEQDARGFCASLDLPRRLYLGGAVRRAVFNDSVTDVGKMERLTATREITLFFESHLRFRLASLGVTPGPSADIGSLLPQFASKTAYSGSDWFKAVQSASYHSATVDKTDPSKDVDALVEALQVDALGLGTPREQFLARCLLMAWLLRNFSSHNFELEVDLFTQAGFHRPAGFLLAAPVVLHLMEQRVDFTSRRAQP